MGLEEAAGDLGHQPFEGFVPAVFGGVKRPVAMDDPADVAGRVTANDDRRFGGGLGRQLRHDRRHRRGDLRAPGPAQRLERRRRLGVGGAVESVEGGAPGAGQPQRRSASVAGARTLVDKAERGEPREDARQIGGVEPQRLGERGGGQIAAVSDLEQTRAIR